MTLKLDLNGEIQNNGTEIVDFVRVTSTFYDANNSIFGSDFIFTERNTLEPGQSAAVDTPGAAAAREGAAPLDEGTTGDDGEIAGEVAPEEDDDSDTEEEEEEGVAKEEEEVSGDEEDGGGDTEVSADDEGDDSDDGRDGDAG